MTNSSYASKVPMLNSAEQAVSRTRKWLTLTACVLAVLAVGLYTLPNYRLFQLTMVLAYANALFGLNLLTGYNGQISLGHGAFYAVGAYAVAIMINEWQTPYWLAVVLAGVVCLVVGFLFGLPALRLEGLYLALATFALAVSTPQILKHRVFEPWTGGVQGLALDKPHVPFGLPLNEDQWLFVFALAVTVVMFWLGINLLNGRVGRALIAIRDQPVAATAMGVNVAMYKSVAFGISAAFAGIGGALGAIATQFLAPDTFTVYLSISFLVGSVVGGIATVPGAILGAIFIQFIPNISEQISKSAPWAVYGVMLIVAMHLFPQGLANLLRGCGRFWTRLGKKKATEVIH
ncbi:branched-chain amino acid ABC transporter permease [Variovorax sp. GB1P17]|uniref:branched-chain amino acid ABC transporter permease n=1 Tax=Variovorax sp. GB1P17 TaxID=3443740 RepID=UPI003F463544